MTTYDTDFVALGGGSPATNTGFLCTGENNVNVGGLLYGYHIGVQGSATSQQGVNYGVIGTVLPAGPNWFPAHSGSVGVFGTSGNGPGVAGMSSLDSGVVGQSGDVYVISGTAGVVGSSQYNPGVSGVSSFGNGVTGGSDTGSGVFAHSNKAAAVVAISGEGFGFSGGAGIGIIGISNAAGPQFAAAGVVGTSDRNQGVLGTSTN